MGAVVSCVRGRPVPRPSPPPPGEALLTVAPPPQIRSALQTIGGCIMAVISGIGGILQAIISGIVSFCGIVVSFLTCGYCGKRRRTTTTRSRV